MLLNLNVGILGHVDSGKTSLAKVISQTSGTAAFDKHPQSQERGITIDLGFSALTVDVPEQLRNIHSSYEKLQFTFVDCPGHASLIKTIIGGAQIIDLMILIIDVTKGIQTQTSECIVIGGLTCNKMLILLNKIDLVAEADRAKIIAKLSKRIHNVLSETVFCKAPILSVSATQVINIDAVVNMLQEIAFVPCRQTNLPFAFAVDHCFPIKGQGTICTGTVLQGEVNVNDEIELPHLQITRKVKSIQMFRKAKTSASQGDRIGICLPKIDTDTLERGLISAPKYAIIIKAAIIKFNPIKYFKGKVSSKSKFHITIGHETALATIILFTSSKAEFNIDHEFGFLDSFENTPINLDQTVDSTPNIFALLEFEKPVIALPNVLVIGSKLDLNVHTPSCRLAFHGHLLESTDEKNLENRFHQHLKICKQKLKEGKILRVANPQELIISNLFKRETNRELFIGLTVKLEPSGELGIIENTFGKTAKVKIKFNEPLSEESLKIITNSEIESKVVLKLKTHIFDKNSKIMQ